MNAQEPAPRRASSRAWLLAWVIAGCALRLTGLGVYSLWYDEGSTVAIAHQEDLRAALSLDRHPPLSYLAVRWWIACFGEDDAVLRLLPALLSCGALIAFARWARGWRGASAAVALFAVAPFQIWHGQELRMYVYVELGALLALLGLERALGGARRTGAALAFGGTALAVGSHYLGSVIAPALAAAGWFRRREMPARSSWTVTAASFLGGLAWVPWIALTLDRRTAQQWGRLGHHDLRAVLEVPTRQILAGFGSIPPRWTWSVYALGAVFAVGWCCFFVRALRRREARDLALAALFVVPIATTWVLDAVLHIGFLPKYAVVAAPAVTLAVAEGWSNLRPAVLRWLVTGLGIGAALAWTVFLRLDNRFEDFRGSSRQLVESWQPADKVVVLTGTPEPFNSGAVRHYLRDRPEILAGIVPVEQLAELERTWPAGQRLHVVHRIHPDAEASVAHIEAAFVLVRRDPRINIEHSLWALR